MGAGTSASTYIRQGATASCNVPNLTGASAMSMNIRFIGSLSIDWGDGTSQYQYSPSTSGEYIFRHAYTAINNNTINIKGNVNTISRLTTGVGGSIQVQPAFTMIQSETSKLKSLGHFLNDDITGNWIFDTTKLPSLMTYYYNSGINQSYGSVGQGGFSYLPSGLTEFSGFTTVGHTGSISPLPSTLKIFRSSTTSNFTGSIDSLPSPLTLFNQTDTNSSITGNITNLPLGLTSFILYGSLTTQTITGDLGTCLNARPLLYDIRVRGGNTITCNFATFSPPIGATPVNIELRGNAIISGNLNQITSNIKGITLVTNNFSLAGDIANLPSTMTSFYVFGTNSQIITGDINSLNGKALTTFVINSMSNITVTGDLANISNNLTNLNISYGSVYGNISSLASKPNLLYIQLAGTTGVITGNVNSVGSAIKSLYITGAHVNLSSDISSLPNQISTLVLSTGSFSYTTSKVWPSVMGRVQIVANTGGGLSTADVDRLLIDLDTYGTSWPNAVSSRYIILSSPHAPRSSASDTAVASLIAKGVTVTTA